MSDRHPFTAADVPKNLIDAGERAIAEASTEDPATELTLTEALRAVLAVVLPLYEDRIGAELGRLTLPCPAHAAPAFFSDCAACHRYAALVGARRIIERRDGYAGLLRRAALQEADDGAG